MTTDANTDTAPEVAVAQSPVTAPVAATPGHGTTMDENVSRLSGGPQSDVTLVAADEARRLLQQMILVRRFEERCVALYGKGDIRGFLHLCDGQEAIAVGVSECLRDDDAVVATYREHGQALARGVSPRAIMAELFGKREGCSHGRGGSMHLFDVARRFYGGNAIVGGGLPLALGLALADKVLRRPRVTACFFGEGAVDEGAFHETMNLASLWGLPLLMVCENNAYSMGTAVSRAEAETDLVQKARSYRVAAERIDGMDVFAVIASVAAAVDGVRRGKPFFLEMTTYRFRAHSMFDAQLYRDRAEVDRWRSKDPLRVLRARCPAISDEDEKIMQRHADQIVDDAVTFAAAGTWEDVSTLLVDVVGPAPSPPPLRTGDLMGPAHQIGSLSPSHSPSSPTAPARASTTTPTTTTTTYRACVAQALRQALHGDRRVFLMGEDIGAYGGCYAVTKGFLAEFSAERILDTPLSELAFVGAGIGAAIGGARPIVEVMTGNFSLLALDQLIHNAATLRHMSGGQIHVPVVLRLATGAGRQLAAQHSHSFEGWYAHIPGLRILAPATLEDARGMLATALHSEDPVLLFEHVALYNREGVVLEPAPAVDITQAVRRRDGNDVSVITYGGSLTRSLEAADELAASGISVAVLDLRVLRPLDDAALVREVKNTHRVVVVDEGWRSGGLSAEVVARINELCFDELDAPPARVCTEEVPLPYPRHLEEAALPSVARIVAAVRAVVMHG
jgi:2-oxoisovalerate dehydrogenase E1 component